MSSEVAIPTTATRPPAPWAPLGLRLRVRGRAHELDRALAGKVRSVPMVDQAARALDQLSRRQRWTGENDLVFVNAVGGVVEDFALRRRFYAALKAAKVPRLRFHDPGTRSGRSPCRPSRFPM